MQYSILTLVLFSCLSSFSQEKEIIYHHAPKESIHLWNKEVPNEEYAKSLAQIGTDKSKSFIRIRKVTDPCLVVYEAKKKNNIGVIVCPGGAYNILAIDKEGYEVAEWLNSLGYTAFVLQYSVPKKQTEALMDIQRAIRVVRAKATDYGIDTEKIGVLGFSAGGNLCARACTRFEEKLYPVQDKMDSLSCKPNFGVLIYPAYLDKGNNNSISPDLNISKNTPPFFIFGTADDRFGNSALVMTQALRHHHIPVTLHFLAYGGHGYGLREGNNAAETWPMLLETWFIKELKLH